MEKASGVYLKITDNTFNVNGTVEDVKIIVPMLTTKGKLGLNDVSADTMESVIGYDLSYNSNYEGLKELLEMVNSVSVWRLNQNATLANAYFPTKSSEKQSVVGATDYREVTEIEINSATPVLAVANKEVGNWMNKNVKFTPNPILFTVQNKNPNGVDDSQLISFDDISSTEKFAIGDYQAEGGVLVYDSSNSYLVGVLIEDTTNNEIKAYKVVDGEVSQSPIGTAVFTDTKLDINLTAPFSKDSYWNFRTIPSTIKEWTISIANKENEKFTLVKTVDFSLDSESDIYIDNIDFGEIVVSIPSKTIPSDWETIRSYFSLDNGSNGDSSITAIDVDVSVLNNCGKNILLTNGITDYRFVNRIATPCKNNKIHAFVDVPSYASYIDAKVWRDKISGNEYIAFAARPDKRYDSNDKEFYVYPSITYGKIYANMVQYFGTICLPPAGYTTGSFTANELIDCDYESHANELKTNRINWQRVIDGTGVMWEQRTAYPTTQDSDLSYINCVFIVDYLSERIVNFERHYNFRIMTRTDILNQQSGLTDILDWFVNKNFVYSYKINMPTYDEAQKAGRTLTIPISVRLTKDSEVIDIELILTNA